MYHPEILERPSSNGWRSSSNKLSSHMLWFHLIKVITSYGSGRRHLLTGSTPVWKRKHGQWHLDKTLMLNADVMHKTNTIVFIRMYLLWYTPYLLFLYLFSLSCFGKQRWYGMICLMWPAQIQKYCSVCKFILCDTIWIYTHCSIFLQRWSRIYRSGFISVKHV